MTRNPIVFGVSVALAAIVLLMGFVLPRGREATEVRAQIATEQAEADRLGAEVQALRAADPVALRAAAARYRDLIPAAVSLPEFLALLDQLATQSGVSISSVNVGQPLAATSGPVTAIGFNVVASGDYFSLARFLFAIEQAPRLMRTSTIAISRGSGGLNLNVSLEAYTTDPNAGPGSDPAVGPEVGS